MGIWERLFGPANAKPRYRAGPVGLGVGVSNLALEQPGRTVDGDFYSPRYNVRGSISPRLSTMPNFGAPRVPAIDLRANGVYLSGDLALAQLIEGARK